MRLLQCWELHTLPNLTLAPCSTSSSATAESWTAPGCRGSRPTSASPAIASPPSGRIGTATAKQTLDAAGKVVCPGFIDAHVHGDLAAPGRPAARAGRPAGRDDARHRPGRRRVRPGVAGDADVHAAATPPGFNGNFPTPGREWRTVTKYLSQFDGQCSINACTLIPNGNVRMEVMGLDPRKPNRGRTREDEAPSSARGWSRARSAFRAASTTSRASTPTRTN